MAVSSTRPSTMDPMVKPTPEAKAAVDDDFAYHVRTYNRFLAVVKAFVIHMAVLLVALYFAVIEGDAVAAMLFVGISIAILVVGLVRRRPIRRDLASAMAEDRNN